MLMSRKFVIRKTLNSLFNLLYAKNCEHSEKIVCRALRLECSFANIISKFLLTLILRK